MRQIYPGDRDLQAASLARHGRADQALWDLKMIVPSVPRRVYKYDPIQEAVCEFRFVAPQAGWSVMAGRLYERLNDLYPNEPAQGMAIVPQPSERPSAPGQVRLSNPDNTALATVGQHLISVHSVRPYMGWELFLEHIDRTLAAFADIVESDFEIERIGLRYINQFA